MKTGCVVGIDGIEVLVEASVARRLPRVIVVGLPASSVRESVERVRSAIVASGFQFPRGCVTVNLAPSGIRKEGTGLDVAIAVGILAAAGELRQCELADVLLAGELGLQGDLKAVPGTLALAVLARQVRIKRLVVPVGCGS
ncbi:MAG: magnesium chelatase domain-containing protein, partial [Myxococcota bacterium]|nr:magnesium chelatase domain-containing protein [Myxococcota bacterium]